MTILIRPLINEKSTKLIEGSWFTFEVSKGATKQLVAKAVTDKFKVDVLDVKVINIAGKNKMQRARRRSFVTADIKKALVKLKKGQKIALFEIASPEKEEVKVTTAEGEEVTTTKEKKSLLRGTKVKIEKKMEASEKKQNLSSKQKGDK